MKMKMFDSVCNMLIRSLIEEIVVGAFQSGHSLKTLFWQVRRNGNNSLHPLPSLAPLTRKIGLADAKSIDRGRIG